MDKHEGVGSATVKFSPDSALEVQTYLNATFANMKDSVWDHGALLSFLKTNTANERSDGGMEILVSIKFYVMGTKVIFGLSYTTRNTRFNSLCEL